MGNGVVSPGGSGGPGNSGIGTGTATATGTGTATNLPYLQQIQNRKFSIVKKGYDQSEVEEFLKQVSAMMSELLEEQAQFLMSDNSKASAQEHMKDIEAKAERRMQAAVVEADRLRTEARRVLENATQQAQEMENVARYKAEQTVGEAERSKQKILGDLMSRRKEAQAHVEMLRAARDELLVSFSQVQHITAQAVEPLDNALDRAKAAADKAVEQFRNREAEIEAETAQATGDAVAADAGTADAVGDAGTADAAAGDAHPDAQAEVDAGVGVSADAPEEPQVLEEVTVSAAGQVGDEAAGAGADGDEAADAGAAGDEAGKTELTDIFARLREQEIAGAESGQTDDGEADEEKGDSQKKTGAGKKGRAKKKSRRKTARAKGELPADKLPDDELPDDKLADDELPGAEDALGGELSGAEDALGGGVQTDGGEQTDGTETDGVSAEAADVARDEGAATQPEQAQSEQLRRRLKQSLTQDESRVLQAIHKFHGKPSKLDALKGALLEQAPRQEIFVEISAEVTYETRLAEMLLYPISQQLDACDLQHGDTKTLVQQVRDIYRQFAHEKIPALADELSGS